MASDRAAALLPARPPGVRHVPSTSRSACRPRRPPRVPDAAADWARGHRPVARARGSRRRPPAEQIEHLSRLMAGEAYQRAWAEYRGASPAWQKHDAALGQLEPLLRAVAEAGPVALYTVDENFFPLSVWLKSR